LKKLWPGTDLDDLEFMAYIDLLSTLEDGSRLVLDIKTAKSALEADPKLLTMDGQLRKYAWVTGCRDVGFLNFVKAGNPNEFRKGTVVTLLSDVRELGWDAGRPLVVVKTEEITDPLVNSKLALVVGVAEDVRIMDEALEQIKGKGSTEAKSQVLADYLLEGKLCKVTRESVTRVKIQLVKGTIPEEEMAEIGQQIGTDMMAIREASKSNAFFMDGGTRFPNAICVWCSFNSICLRDNKRRDETLVKIGPAAKEDDWLTELEAGEEE
jgi:hypothetical protein